MTTLPLKGGESMSSTELNIKGSLLPVNRIESLSDGAFAIVMTLLVLELSVPVITGSSVNAELLSKLIELWPKLLVYMLSFIILGMMWAHHRFHFHCIIRSDGQLAWMNIFILMFVALIPFTTSLIGEYSDTQVAVVVYGINVLLIMISSLAIWIYITGKHELSDRAIDTEIATRRKVMSIIGCLFFIIGIGLSFLNPIISLYIYGLAVLLSIIFSWRDSHGYLSILFVRMREKRKKKQ
jgi:uncharacterized membrane protein